MSILNNNATDPNKILPMTYKWARKHYKDGVNNNWTPEEVNMQKDVETWKHPSALTADLGRRHNGLRFGFQKIRGLGSKSHD